MCLKETSCDPVLSAVACEKELPGRETRRRKPEKGEKGALESPFFSRLSSEEQALCRAGEASFPVLVTPYYYSLMKKDNGRDPLALQVFPQPEEGRPEKGAARDPLGETDFMPLESCIRKYEDRIVLLVSQRCAVHCRHCNRRNFLAENPPPGTKEFRRIFDYIRSQPSIRDVILSGGDPLMLGNGVLAFLLNGLRKIPHVKILRIGTRIPVVLPERIDEDLAALLSGSGPLWVNTQFNHPAEVTSAAAKAVDRLLRAGVPVNNQAVLLRGVNDDFATLKELSLRLLEIKVRPYYLFQCDPVYRAGHFRVPEVTGRALVNRLNREISGLGVPFYVRDTREKGKLFLAPGQGGRHRGKAFVKKIGEDGK